jgi:hypothetical protein
MSPPTLTVSPARVPPFDAGPDVMAPTTYAPKGKVRFIIAPAARLRPAAVWTAATCTM